MIKKTLQSVLTLALVFVCLGVNAQNAVKPWDVASKSDTEQLELEFRNSMPLEFNIYSLDVNSLKEALAEAPKRFSANSNVIVEFPVNNGSLERFRVYEFSNFASELQERHPNIRSYTAQGIDDPSAIARFSVSQTDGFHAMISSVHYKTIYIDPYTTSGNYHISYAASSLEPDSRSFDCLMQEQSLIDPTLEIFNADDGLLRTYRLALACTGEYAQFHLSNQGIDPGATDEVKKAAVLTAMNTSMTRVNGIYERDIAVHMEIIPNNEDIIYLIAASDPYTNNNGGAMLGQNQSTIDGIIGNDNYDIGHVYSTGGGGIAGLGVVCVPGNKARGVTGLPQPIGDPFYVDYVSHEMGHQFRANHTQNNSCQRNGATAMEPGSASTIMGYAGICPPNVQNVSDDYFHAVSIQEIWSFISAGSGGSCPVETETGNSPPTADAGPDYTIPKSTPFILRGIATDPDEGDVHSHNWEQMNPQVGPMPPQNTSVVGPMFRSNVALASPDRYMPAIETVLAGQTQTTWEVVPSVERTMNFRYTVRDNVAGGASSASDNTVISVHGASGPFVVTSQDAAETWQTQTMETITWDVAGTDAAPVSCATVDILFSTDGGFTYDVVVADDTPNDGSEEVNVPNVNTTTGRFMIIGSDNIFYDVNGGVITVEGEILSTSEMNLANFALYPNPSNGTYNIAFTPNSDDKITISLYDLRGRMINTQEFDNATTSDLFRTTLEYGTINSGMYFVKIKNGSSVVTKKLIKQ